MGKAFESIKQGLTEAVGHAKGTQAGVKVWRPAAVDVAAVRGPPGRAQSAATSSAAMVAQMPAGTP